MRIIDADLLKKHYAWWEDDRQKLFDSIIDQQPTVDAEPVRHGKWKNDGAGVLRCSECNAQAPWKYGMDYIDYRWKANYCPNCGARMVEE